MNILKMDRELAQELGVPAQSVALLREEQLLPDVHFEKKKGGGFTDSGRHLVKRGLGLDVHGLPEKMETAEQQLNDDNHPYLPERPLRARLRVLSLCPNPIFVDVAVPEGSDKAMGRRTVRVRNNRRLSPGTRLWCERGADGAWKCVEPTLRPLR